MYRFAYLAGAAFWVVVYIIVYIFFRRGRRAMLWTSLVYCPAGPISEFWSLKDYWHPQYVWELSFSTWRFGLEDSFLAAALAGLSAAAFEALGRRKGYPEIPRILLGTVLWMGDWAFLGFLLMILMNSVAQLSSMNSLLLTLTALSLAMLMTRKKYLSLALLLAGAAFVIYWLFYRFFSIPFFPGAFEALWKLDATWGFRIGGVPVEECLWALAAVLFCGPVYRVCSELAQSKKLLAYRPHKSPAAESVDKPGF